MTTRATIADVAKLAGVHPGTVSRALNEKTRSQVNVETARRVRRVAKQLGYVPNTVARGLRTSLSMTVGVVIPDITNPIFPPIVRGIDSYLGAHGYSSLVVNTDGSDAAERALFASLMGRQVDGLIVATGHSEHALMMEAHGHGVRAVMVNRDAIGVPYSSVTGDDAHGIRASIEHLAQLGHTRIVHLAGPVGFSTSLIRRDAFVAACQVAGVSGLVVDTAAYSIDAGQAAMDSLLDGASDDRASDLGASDVGASDPVTAVVAGNDLLALGAYHSLRSHGLRCPDDISVIGFNDMLFAGDFQPAMTTVRVPHFEMGAEAARLILGEIANSASSAVRIMLPVSLVVRGSTGPRARRQDGFSRTS